jgi:hypothetical protein
MPHTLLVQRLGDKGSHCIDEPPQVAPKLHASIILAMAAAA